MEEFEDCVPMEDYQRLYKIVKGYRNLVKTYYKYKCDVKELINAKDRRITVLEDSVKTYKLMVESLTKQIEMMNKNVK